MQRAASTLRGAGATSVVACAGHGLFVDEAAGVLADEAIAQLVVTDSVPTFRLPADASVRGKLRIVSCAPLFADAIRLQHAAG